MDLKERARRGEKVRLTDMMPVWVSRKDTDGMIYNASVPMWAVLSATFAFQLWTLIALVAAVAIILGVPLWLLLTFIF